MTAILASRHLFRRFRHNGWRSGFSYLQSRLTNAYVSWRNRSSSARAECPVCGWRGHDFLMLDCGRFVVPHVTCPQCQSQERHRLLHLYLRRRDLDFAQRQGPALHFAPEPHIRSIIDSNAGVRCFSTDWFIGAISAHAQTAFQSDIQQLSARDEAFELVFCLHVLEHIPDDRQAVRELHRVLKKGGVAYVMVPFMMGWPKTVEFGAPDPAIFDHVRGYSTADFRDRLAPFAYEEIVAPDFLSKEETRRYRIPPDSQVIYRCTKTFP